MRVMEARIDLQAIICWIGFLLTVFVTRYMLHLTIRLTVRHSINLILRLFYFRMFLSLSLWLFRNLSSSSLRWFSRLDSMSCACRTLSRSRSSRSSGSCFGRWCILLVKLTKLSCIFTKLSRTLSLFYVDFLSVILYPFLYRSLTLFSILFIEFSSR